MQNYTLEFNEALWRLFHCKLWICRALILHSTSMRKREREHFTWKINRIWVTLRSINNVHLSSETRWNVGSSAAIANSNGHSCSHAKWMRRREKKNYLSTPWSWRCRSSVNWGFHRIDHRKIIEMISIIMGWRLQINIEFDADNWLEWIWLARLSNRFRRNEAAAIKKGKHIFEGH